MKRKNILALTFVTLLLGSTAKAQLYVNAGVGFGAPALRDMLLVDVNESSSSVTYTGIYSSLGTGFQPGLTLGYKVNPNIGVELGYGYLLGSRIHADIYDASSANIEEGSQEMWARMNQITIGGRVTAAEGPWQPYLCMGIGFGLGGRAYSEIETVTNGPSFNSSYHRIEVFDGGTAFAFTGGLGMNYHMSDRFGIFMEASMVAQQWSPNHSEITTLVIDGQDQLPFMTIRQKETNYVSEYTDPSGPPNDGEPDPDLRFYFPMSSIGIAAGVHFYFGQ